MIRLKKKEERNIQQRSGEKQWKVGKNSKFFFSGNLSLNFSSVKVSRFKSCKSAVKVFF